MQEAAATARRGAPGWRRLDVDEGEADAGFAAAAAEPIMRRRLNGYGVSRGVGCWRIAGSKRRTTVTVNVRGCVGIRPSRSLQIEVNDYVHTLRRTIARLAAPSGRLQHWAKSDTPSATRR